METVASPRAVVIEDDRVIALLVGEALEQEGFSVTTVHDGVDGLEVCRRLWARRSDVLVLMLTAKTSDLDRVLGLEIGAGAYVTKPFSLRELQARAKALRRRKRAFEETGVPSRTLSSGPLAIDVAGQSVRLRDGSVHLTQREFRSARSLRAPSRPRALA